MSQTKVKVLLVDDDHSLREIIGEQLISEGGFEVTEMENGKKALESLLKSSVDIVVSDIRMPGGDGVTLLKEIMKMPAGQQPPVILMTGYSDYPENDLFSFGAKAVLAKPFRIEDLLEQISKHVS